MNLELRAASMLLALLLCIAVSGLSACNGGKMPQQTVTFPSIKDVPASSWQKLSQKKIFFGHQSVGNNILDGVRDLIKENPKIQLSILETAGPEDFQKPIFGHERVGDNTKPLSKLKAFSAAMESGLGGQLDTAFLKFCYVDVVGETDVEKLFSDYRDAFKNLAAMYPHIKFVHLTVPLTVTKQTWKTYTKKLLGKNNIWEYADNIKRNEFNDLIRKEYGDKEAVFDLAKVESTSPEGKRSSFAKDGITYYSLFPDYTHDGGHLNGLGRKIVAEQLLILLANTANNQL
jgi:hypothetical protein